MKKKMLRAIALLVMTQVFASAGDAELRVQSRAKVWDIYWNSGTQGVRAATPMSWYRPVGMSYPGRFWVQFPQEFVDYWGTRRWGVRSEWVVYYNELCGTMPGWNQFIATRVGGDYHVSESKATLESEDVVPMAYDPSQGPESNIGYRKVSPLGPVMANWWSGQPAPGPGSPVEIHNYRYSEYMEADKDNFPESIIVSKWTTKNGITVTKKSYAWSYPDFDDFQILEYTFENTGDSDGDGVADLGGGGLQLNDTFLIFSTRFYASQCGQAHYAGDSFFRRTIPIALDDWYKYTEAANFDGPGDALGLKMWYAFDGENPDLPGNDIGKPYSEERAHSSWHQCCLKQTKIEGEMGAFQYIGAAPLAYTPGSANDASTFTFDTGGDASFIAPRVADQPHTVKWWDYRDRTDFSEPGSENRSSEQIYNELTSPAPFIMDNPTTIDGLVASFAYGPYDLAPGDKVRIVYALVAAAPVEENIYGWAKQSRQEDMLSDKPMNNLLKHHKAAADAFRWNYDLPDPPPDVKTEVTASVDGFNLIKWTDAGDDATDPDYTGAEAQDIVGYRAYRSEYKIDDWKLMADIPLKDPEYYSGGAYQIEDRKSVAGFEYTYRVAAYDSGHDDWNGTGMAIPSMEGGNSAPEQWAGGVMTSVPFVPANASADQLARDVIVVPNPHKVDGAHNYPSAGLIRFTNVPQKCTIRIYTVAGELAALIEHNDPARGEAGWDQIPHSRGGDVPAGVYYWIVESQMPGSAGQTQRGTLMIIK